MAINGTCEATLTRPQNSYPILARGLEGFNSKGDASTQESPHKEQGQRNSGIRSFKLSKIGPETGNFLTEGAYGVQHLAELMCTVG